MSSMRSNHLSYAPAQRCYYNTPFYELQEVFSNFLNFFLFLVFAIEKKIESNLGIQMLQPEKLIVVFS